MPAKTIDQHPVLRPVTSSAEKPPPRGLAGHHPGCPTPRPGGWPQHKLEQWVNQYVYAAIDLLRSTRALVVETTRMALVKSTRPPAVLQISSPDTSTK